MIIYSCVECDMIGFASMEGVDPCQVHQTRDRRADCGFVHRWEVTGAVNARDLAHVGLSTLLRIRNLPDWHREGIHTVQGQLSAPDVLRRVGWPVRLMDSADGYGLSSDGLVTARMVCKWVAGQTKDFKESMMWRSVAGLLAYTF